LSLPGDTLRLRVKNGLRHFPNFSAISNARELGFVLKCSPDPGLPLDVMEKGRAVGYSLKDITYHYTLKKDKNYSLFFVEFY
jgi:hypothetical protein